eukprot:5126143-Pleurochrysis_carterae.AAC.1
MGLIDSPGTEATTDAVCDELTLWLSRAGGSLGFVWDSATLTRTLEETNLSAYLQQILHFANSCSMSLMRNSQKLADRIQRAPWGLHSRARGVNLRIFSRLSGFVPAVSYTPYVVSASSRSRHGGRSIAA